MKTLKTFCLLVIFILPGIASLAQCKVTSGDPGILKGQKVVNLQFDYSNMGVGKFKNESDYVADKTATMNKKKPGDGDRWAQAWKNDRASRFQPTFEKYLNERLMGANVTYKENAPEAKYTMIVHTIFTEPGYNAGITRENAWIKLEINIIETSNPSAVLATIEMKRVDSINMWGGDFDTGSRIQSAYDKAGGFLGIFLAKSVFR